MAELPFLDLSVEDHDGVVEEIVSLDSFPSWSHVYGLESDSLSVHRHLSSTATAAAVVFDGDLSDWIPGSDDRDRKNQVTFVMDLFHQRVEQSDFTGREEFVSETINEPNLVVIEENCEVGANRSLELGLGLAFDTGIGFDGDSDDDCSCGGSAVSDCGDEFVVARRESGNGNSGGLFSVGGVRVIDIDSDSDSDFEEGNGLLGIDLHSDEEDYAADNLDDEDIGVPLCWDSFQLDDHGGSNNDFEWEEVDDRVDEREVLSFAVEPDPDEEGSVSILPISGPEEDGNVGRGRGLGNLEWEVLMDVNNQGRNLELESDPGPYFSDLDDNSYNSEYELMFGPLADGENPLLARPPASKSIVDKLPTVVITREDVLNERALCAVCKDQIEVNEEVKRLPCSHWYHGDCILPWLGIRNTCPVCRYELPTDDPDYENRRTRRAARLL